MTNKWICLHVFLLWNTRENARGCASGSMVIETERDYPFHSFVVFFFFSPRLCCLSFVQRIVALACNLTNKSATPDFCSTSARMTALLFSSFFCIFILAILCLTPLLICIVFGRPKSVKLLHWTGVVIRANGESINRIVDLSCRFSVLEESLGTGVVSVTARTLLFAFNYRHLVIADSEINKETAVLAEMDSTGMNKTILNNT